MAAGVSGRQLASILGLSEGAVRKAKATRLKGALLPDGSFDVDRARALYATNTDPSMQRTRPSTHTAVSGHAVDAAPNAIPPSVPAGPDYNRARTFLVLENAKIAQVKRKKAEGSSIEKAPTEALVQTLARTFRDAQLGFTDKHYSQIASELGVDPFRCYEVLEKYQRLYVEHHIARIKTEVMP